ncbi:aminoacyl--tRNA ligase-related protein [Wukongibacter baidiensis]|uniref:His/Gly/Thr/Pro-type tRNA ligase C-terminal domain-containing protein n=1 Tax=Wukongibacter baidiensis TaxID=1723361 RepID=UPI003D7F738F
MMNREMINSKIAKRQIILDVNGKEYDVDKIEAKNVLKKYDVLNKFLMDEKGLKRSEEMPKSISAMQRLELVDYESASDSGHFRFYPKGNLIFDLIKDWADEIALNRLDSLKIETPLIYDYNEPDIKEQVKSFHERHYVVNAPGKDREFILRFAGDFGLFRMLKDAKLSYKNLPFRVYEYSKSFRYEKSGELAGLKRLRAFSMPDIHSLAKDIEEGFHEYKELYKNYYDLAKAMDINFVVVFRAVEDFYYKHKEEIQELVSYGGVPVFIELLSDMKHYWAIKSEFQTIDCNDGFLQLSTVQLDVKDADIYGIRYVNSEGIKKGCIICHSSIGSIERWMYAILEASLMKEKPELPYWLSPVQVRLLPINDKFQEHAENIASKLKSHNVRVEIDDRDERLGRKIRDAQKSWVPFVMVIGENEVQNDMYSLKARSGEEMKNINLRSIIKSLMKEQNGMPFRKINLNMKLSRQPVFRG